MSVLPEYNPADFEKDLGVDDVCHQRFHSQINNNKLPYTIVMPPPNITGILHMGHILNNTIQDVLVRYKRMDGFEACWIPGLDHASIATESKVTQWLADQNINKKDIGREKFLEYAMQWKKEYGGIINDQLKRLGVSCDWERECFTMDPHYSQAVLESFITLFNEKLIYKGTRMVNWCPVSCSAISDEEVEYREEQGYLWYFSYPIKDSHESIIIATTRPETMFGDTAIMVHPKDDRYKDLIGKTVLLPLMHREICIIGDEYVDPEFGTGAVKVTPAHDPNDYEVGLRHQLDMPIVMTETAIMNDNVPKMFQGLDRFEARKLVIEELDKKGLLIEYKSHSHRVGYSQRGNVPIESVLSEQWFMSMKNMAIPAKKSVEEGDIKFYPSHWKKTYFYWMDNIKDWCISRQLWWGHRIPIYYCKKCEYQVASLQVCYICPQCQFDMVQDDSVLDTWASSWLWSYAVHKTEEEKTYYHPTDTLVTGPDIIFFWVARMIMAAHHFRKEIPFKNVYFTGIIRDDLGRKMSKSLGNSPDPLDVIAEYGADALRFSIIRLAPLGNDILYSSKKIELGKKFANKLWNAARFLSMHIAENKTNMEFTNHDHIILSKLDDFDKSTLTRLNNTVKKVRDHFDKFRINDVAKDIYDFIWRDFCDRYIENSKNVLHNNNAKQRMQKVEVMCAIFSRILRLLHPIMPFITEKLSRELLNESQILFAVYPSYNQNEIFSDVDDKMERLEYALYMIREVCVANNVQNQKPKGIIAVVPELKEFFEQNKHTIQKQARFSVLEIVDFGRSLQSGEATASECDFQIFVDLSGMISKDIEISRLKKEKSRLDQIIQSIHNKLKNSKFIANAPKAVIERETEKLKSLDVEYEQVIKALKIWD